MESETGAWGFIARDKTGDFLAAAAGKMNHVRSALHAKVVACMRAIEGATDLGAQRISFELDYLTMIFALKGGAMTLRSWEFSSGKQEAYAMPLLFSLNSCFVPGTVTKWRMIWPSLLWELLNPSMCGRMLPQILSLSW